MKNKPSIYQFILQNIEVFVFIFILEVVSGLPHYDQFKTLQNFITIQFSFSIIGLLIIDINHYILIPKLFDKRRYLVYTLSLLSIIVLTSYIWKGSHGWPKVIGVSFYTFYFTGFAMAIFFIFRNFKIKNEVDEKIKLQQSLELNYLKAQVNPHFLFNTLNSIYSLSRQQSPDTPNTVMQLSDLMRYQLETAKKETVSLQEEITFLQNYLLLEENRIGKRCTIDFCVQENIRDIKIAPMLFIPFVENAVKYGAQSTNENSTINILIETKEKDLYFFVENSKPLITISKKGEGIGISNVERRLNLLYPNHHKLTLNDTPNSFTVQLHIDLESLKVN